MNMPPNDHPDHARRRLLLGLGTAGAALAGAQLCPAVAGTAAVTQAPPSPTLHQRQPFFGPHQAGVVTPRPAAGLLVAFDVLATDRSELERLLRTLDARIRFLTQGGPVPELDPRLPPADSGVLGPEVTPDNLTITLAVGASLFDERFGLAALKPRQLQRMIGFPNDALEAGNCHGDVLLQFCANTADTTLHALRDLLKQLPDLLAIRWTQDGSVPVQDPPPGQPAASARNFLGFRDGSANPDSSNDAAMARIVWVAAGNAEPAWATGGSYQVVRIIRNLVERWDRTPLQEQEAIIGRRKASGAPLAGGQESDAPDYHQDREGRVTPLTAHIRLANPRTPQSQHNLILRRPFNYANGLRKNGQLDMGLLFICFQADLEQGFIAVQRRLDGEPLEEYVKPVGGGYFFVLPGVTDPQDFLGGSMLAAASHPSHSTGDVE